MEYHHVELNPDARIYCTIILPWGKYEYQRLPMELANAPDIFQENMSTHMRDLEYVRAYIDDLLTISKGDWTDHLDKLKEVLKRVQKSRTESQCHKIILWKRFLRIFGILDYQRRNPTHTKENSSNTEYCCTKNHKRRKEIRRNGKLLQGYVDQKI